MSDKNNIAIALSDDERQRCEVWTRVMGYHRPVTSFNPGKRSEHKERIHFSEKAVTRSKKTILCG